MSFGHPIALSVSEQVDLRAVSTQGHNGVLDVVEVSYLVRGDAEARVQPSVWTWLAGTISGEDAVSIHAVTHHISHLPDFRSGARVPDSAETDELQRQLLEAPRKSSPILVNGISMSATRFEFGPWSYGSVATNNLLVTIAGPESFVRCPLRMRIP
ncbi:hypothetical protein VD659_18105 [Herbiconiux sp. 11R-BC]